MKNNNQLMDDMYKWAFKNNRLISVTIELTSLCNWRCVHCYIPDYQIYGLPYEKIIELLYQLRENNVFDLILTGGEALLREDLVDIVSFARRLGFRVSILSNASLVTEDFAKKLSKLYISSFSSTIFSMNEHIHDSITRKKDSLKHALRGLCLLKKYNIPIEIKTPILNLNCEEYREIYKFTVKNNFEYTCSPIIFPSMDGNLNPLKHTIDNNILMNEIETIDELMNFNRNRFLPNEPICSILNYSVYITSEGMVYPCGSYPIKMGNIYNDFIMDIWENELSRSIRERKNDKLTECLSCHIAEYCNYCPGISFLETGNELNCSQISKNLAQTRYKVSENKK